MFESLVFQYLYINVFSPVKFLSQKFNFFFIGSAAPSEISDNGVDTTAEIQSNKFSFNPTPSPKVRSTPASSTQDSVEVSPPEAPRVQVGPSAVISTSSAAANAMSPTSQVH